MARIGKPLRKIISEPEPIRKPTPAPKKEPAPV